METSIYEKEDCQNLEVTRLFGFARFVSLIRGEGRRVVALVRKITVPRAKEQKVRVIFLFLVSFFFLQAKKASSRVIQIHIGLLKIKESAETLVICGAIDTKTKRTKERTRVGGTDAWSMRKRSSCLATVQVELRID